VGRHCRPIRGGVRRRVSPAGAGNRCVLLLPGLLSDDSRSMKRYAEELHAALRASTSDGLAIAMERPPDRRYLSRLADANGARRIDRAWCRWVTYPGVLKQRSAAVFHILDQGYAHLIRSLDPARTIVTCHDIIPLLAAQGAIPSPVSARAAWIFRRKIAYLTKARRIIAVSTATKVTLERYTAVDPSRVTVVPNGLNATFRFLPDARATRRAAAGLRDTTPVVLQVATAGRYKNTATLLHAIAGLRPRVPDLVLLRVGAPLLPDEAHLARTLGVADCLRHLGDVATDQLLTEWYNAADVLVFPSAWEGFGWPPLEAMACGTPVVAFDIPPVAEVVGTAGLLVPPGDMSALAAATERILTDTGLAAELRQRGRQRAAQFTWTATAARTATIYAELLADTRSRQ